MVDQKSTLFFFVFIFLLLKSTFEQETTSSSWVEKSALLKLRSSLGLRSRDWPVKGDPCLNWNGVNCNKNGNVIKINISGFRRTRIGNLNRNFAVDSLVNLTRLTSFNASRFSLPGSIPVWFGSLKNLQVLDLSSCSIVGTIPESLVRLSSLEVLDLSENSLNGSIPVSIGTLSKLKRLNLSSNGLSSSIPLSLGDISGLVDLDLSFNDFSGLVPSELKGLRKLQTFVIAGNRFSGYIPSDLFSVQSKLQIVDFKGNGFIGGLPSGLWSLPEIKILDFSGNNFSDPLPSSNIIDSTVSMLNISGNMFYGNLTVLLRRFQVLDISRNYFEGKVPDFMMMKVNASSSLSYNCLQGIKNQRGLSDCGLFYYQKGLTFDNFGKEPKEEEERASNRPWLSQGRNRVILAAVGGSILVMLILIMLPIMVSLCIRRRNRSSTSIRNNGVGPLPPEETLGGGGGGGGGGGVGRGVSMNIGTTFTYQQLLNATMDFRDSNLIKKGQSGDLFKGVLETGVQIVVKRISSESSQYQTELDFFGRFAHPRIVPFVGNCLENPNAKFLVYKYMVNGDLPSSLFYKTSSLVDDGLKSLDWITRLKIALGAAEGLSYLHHDCSPSIAHRDVQASSILLDDKFEVRLGSFSKACHQENKGRPRKITRLLSRLSQSSQESVPGSPATATCAYDVYCFGKVLLELITGKLGISSCDEQQFKKLITTILPHISSQDKEPINNILDQSLLVDDDLLEEVWAMAIVARSCLNPKPTRRPLMRHIVQALENPLRVVRDDSSESDRFRVGGSSRGSSSSGRVFGSWRQHSSSLSADPVAAGTSSLLSQAEGLGRSCHSSVRGSSRGATSSSRRSMKDV